jgi:methyl-accepting chemotaxis protein
MIPGIARLRPGEPAPVLGGPAPAEVASRVVEQVDLGRQRVARRVDEVRQVTEREILACGRVLSNIVETARALIQETDKAIADAKARSEHSTARFIGEMQMDIRAQEAVVKDVLVLAGGIEESISAINNLAEFSNLLSVNARIEAGRIGEAGAGFAVIADQTRDLSTTIGTTAHKVTTAIAAVRQGLPPISEHARSMHERARAFGEAVAKEMEKSDGASIGTRRLEDLIRLSNEALSHLQFQDPVAQELAAINRDLEILAARIGRVIEGHVYTQEPVMRGPVEARPVAGKVTLF